MRAIAARNILAATTTLPNPVSRIKNDMEASLSIQVMTGADDTFCNMLTDAGVEFTKRPPLRGVIVMSAGDTLDIVQNIASNAAWPAAIATVLVAWIKSKNSRKAIFTTKDNEVHHAFEGMSPDEIERLVKQSRDIMAIDTAPQKKNKKG